MPFQRRFPSIELKSGLFAIRGPRQIGKSSWMKSLLSRELGRKRKCHYVSCENIEDYRDLTLLLQSLENVEIIFLDEITFVKEWTRSIKHQIDMGSKQVFVVTGSNAADIRRGIDLMPGRWGAGGEFLLQPMLFDEFSEMRRLAGWKRSDRVEELELYFRTGGFPLAVAEAGEKSAVPKKAMQLYWQWLKGDVIKLGKQELYLKELLGQLAKSLCTPMSLQSLAQKTQMGSHHTAQEYVAILEDCFALKTLFAIDVDGGNFRFKKNKKFYFTDPLVYWIALEKGGYKIPENFSEKLAEMVAHELLSRKGAKFGYFSSKAGEVDFVAPGGWAIEVKWVDAVTQISSAYKNLRIARKKVWSKSNFLAE